MEIIWKDLGLRIMFAIIGLAIYSLIKVRDKIAVFDPAIFFKENKGFWIWAMSLQLIFAFLLTIDPTAAEAIKSMTGLDYSQTMAFVTSGAGLGALANMASRDKIGTKTEK